MKISTAAARGLAQRLSIGPRRVRRGAQPFEQRAPRLNERWALWLQGRHIKASVREHGTEHGVP